ncbi:ubiquitin-like small modifier protein 1 [Halorubrum tibetense]|uniref:Ubiquitin-like small modifier protein 1 n=1 Tax=Halorubrum tibetense TaxID=175631 RepID=A0ABD5SBL8_9EURY
MEIECRFFGPFREAVDGNRVVLDIDADTYGELLALLEDRYPELAGRLVDGDGGFAGSTVVTRNGTDLRHLDGLDTPVQEGDVVRTIPSVYGGCTAGRT